VPKLVGILTNGVIGEDPSLLCGYGGEYARVDQALAALRSELDATATPPTSPEPGPGPKRDVGHEHASDESTRIHEAPQASTGCSLSAASTPAQRGSPLRLVLALTALALASAVARTKRRRRQ